MLSSKYAILECIKAATAFLEDSEEFESVSSNLWSSLTHSVSLSSLVEVLPRVMCGLLPAKIFVKRKISDIQEGKTIEFQINLFRKFACLEEDYFMLRVQGIKRKEVSVKKCMRTLPSGGT